MAYMRPATSPNRPRLREGRPDTLYPRFGPRPRAARRGRLPGQSRTRGGSLLYDLIRSQQQRWRDGEAERLRGLAVDHQLELPCPFNWKIARLCRKLHQPPAIAQLFFEVCATKALN